MGTRADQPIVCATGWEHPDEDIALLEDGYRVVTPDEVMGALEMQPDLLLLDVRTPREFASHRVPGSLLMPVTELGCRLKELNPARTTICLCEHGIRSETAAQLLAEHNFRDVSTMHGGLVRWRGPLERGQTA